LFEHDLFGKPLRTFPDHALGIKARDGEVLAHRGKGLFGISILEAKASAQVSLLDPPVDLASPSNTGRFGTQLIQLPAVGPYNQTIGFGHENTSEENLRQKRPLFLKEASNYGRETAPASGGLWG
jgi:hypothetical protein